MMNVTARIGLALVSCSMFMNAVHADSHQYNEYVEYCSHAGGVVEEMPAEFSTYRGLVKGQSKIFCNFSAGNGFVSIGLATFASDKPSIAATFIKKLDEISPNSSLWEGKYANPSHNVCKNLGGSAIGFVVNGGFSNPLGQADICVFGDGSMVSAWSLIYMANHREGYDNIKNQVKAEPLSMHMPTGSN